MIFMTIIMHTGMLYNTPVVNDPLPYVTYTCDYPLPCQFVSATQDNYLLLTAHKRNTMLNMTYYYIRT